MKTCSRVACLVMIVAIFLAGCRSSATPAPVVNTVVASPATATALPAPATQPPPTLPLPSPTAAPVLPTQPPTAAPPATVAPATPPGSPVPTLEGPQLEGLWHGGGNNLLLDFFIALRQGVASLIDVGILWSGPGECELDARYTVEVPVDENGFSMTYNKDDVYFVLATTDVSPELILGTFYLRYKGCGEHRIAWRAVLKTGMGQRP